MATGPEQSARKYLPNSRPVRAGCWQLYTRREIFLRSQFPASRRCGSAKWFGRAFAGMLWRADRYVNARASLQLRVLRRGFLQDGDVAVGVLYVVRESS
jgi:hypothetical protein